MFPQWLNLEKMGIETILSHKFTLFKVNTVYMVLLFRGRNLRYSPLSSQKLATDASAVGARRSAEKCGEKPIINFLFFQGTFSVAKVC
jgi:hypothetical protein